MKKITLLLLTICNVLLFAQANKSTDILTPKVEKAPIVYTNPTKPYVSLADYYNAFNAQNLIAPKLYGQFPVNAETITSQKFEASNSQFDSNAADDFVVPTNKIWTINSVSVRGQSFSKTYPTSYNLTFYTNSGANLPNTIIRTENVVLAAGSVSPTLPLATPLILTEGKYWVSVQAVMDISQGQWFWETYNDLGTLNAPFAWINPNNGFSTTCNTAWNTASVCLPTQLKDLQFSIDGTESNPCRMIIGRINTTDATQNGRLYRDGIPSACGTAKAYPGILNSGTNYHYKTYSFQNTSASSECVTITFTNADPDDNQVLLTAYNTTFNPADLSQNYMGDTGYSSSTSTIVSMAINVPAGATVVLITSEVTLNSVFGADYTINISSANCAAILKTVENPKDAVSVYPNPTSNVLFVNGMKPTQANVYDVSGKQIPTKVNGNTIDTQQLPKGNYILKMEDKEGKTTTTKFIKK